MIESLLNDLYRYLNIPSSKGKNEAEGYYVINVSQGVEVWARDLNPGVFFKSILFPLIRPKDREDFFIYLGKANFLGQGTGGAVISLDAEEKLLTFSLCISYDINYRIFRDKLEDFVNYLEFWRSELKRLEVVDK